MPPDGRCVVDLSLRDHSAFGAAVFAAASLGSATTRDSAQHHVEPRAEATESWNDIAERHDALRRDVSGGDTR